MLAIARGNVDVDVYGSVDVVDGSSYTSGESCAGLDGGEFFEC